jgi:hypothetical protein
MKAQKKTKTRTIRRAKKGSNKKKRLMYKQRAGSKAKAAGSKAKAAKAADVEAAEAEAADVEAEAEAEAADVEAPTNPKAPTKPKAPTNGMPGLNQNIPSDGEADCSQQSNMFQLQLSDYQRMIQQYKIQIEEVKDTGETALTAIKDLKGYLDGIEKVFLALSVMNGTMPNTAELPRLVPIGEQSQGAPQPPGEQPQESGLPAAGQTPGEKPPGVAGGNQAQPKIPGGSTKSTASKQGSQIWTSTLNSVLTPGIKESVFNGFSVKNKFIGTKTTKDNDNDRQITDILNEIIVFAKAIKPGSKDAEMKKNMIKISIDTSLSAINAIPFPIKFILKRKLKKAMIRIINEPKLVGELIGCIDKNDQEKRYAVYEDLIKTLIDKVIPETPNLSLSEADIVLTEEETNEAQQEAEQGEGEEAVQREEAEEGGANRDSFPTEFNFDEEIENLKIMSGKSRQSGGSRPEIHPAQKSGPHGTLEIPSAHKSGPIMFTEYLERMPKASTIFWFYDSIVFASCGNYYFTKPISCEQTISFLSISSNDHYFKLGEGASPEREGVMAVAQFAAENKLFNKTVYDTKVTQASTLLKNKDFDKMRQFSKFNYSIGIIKRLAYFWLFMEYILRTDGIDGLCEGGWYSDFIFKREERLQHNPFIRFDPETATLSSEDVQNPTFPGSEDEMKISFYPVQMVTEMVTEIEKIPKYKAEFDTIFKRLFNVSSVSEVVAKIQINHYQPLYVYDQNSFNKLNESDLGKVFTIQGDLTPPNADTTYLDKALNTSGLKEDVDKLETQIKELVGGGVAAE